MSSQNTRRPAVLIARAIFPEVVARLRTHFDVEDNPDNDNWSAAEFQRRLQGKQGVLTTGGQHIDAALLAACPQLKICANMAVGYDNFDVPAMTAAGVLATNAPGVLTETTADGGLALLLAAARRITEAERFLRAGRWQEWAYDTMLGQDVHGATLGIIGMGRIGQAIARRGAGGFDMRVLYHNRSRLPADTERAAGNAQYMSKEALLKQADHVVLVVPATQQTHHLIGAAELALMKRTATLVNIGRGGVVDEAALAQALQQGQIAAAGLDVFEGEPKVHPALLQCDNIVLTPHIASASTVTRRAMANLAADNLIAYLTRGEAKTPLNPQLLPRA